MIVLSVMYPAGEDFDYAYYTNQHIPLLQRHWGPHVVRTSVLKGVSSADGGPPAYQLVALVEFASIDALQAAMASAGTAEITGDVARFTPCQPLIQINEVHTS